MIWTLAREVDNGIGIRGQLLGPDGKTLFYTMEPSIRRAEHPGILPGVYRMRWTRSTRLKRETLELPDVPAIADPRYPADQHYEDWRHGIRIHPLNAPTESLGCIGLGLGRTNGMWISSSKIAVSRFEVMVLGVMRTGDHCFLRVTPSIRSV